MSERIVDASRTSLTNILRMCIMNSKVFHLLIRIIVSLTILDFLLAVTFKSYYNLERVSGMRAFLSGWYFWSSIILPVTTIALLIISRDNVIERKKYLIDCAFACLWCLILWLGSLIAWFVGGYPWL